MTTTSPPIRLCACGCGQASPIAKRTRPHLGHVKGQPTKFRMGHSGAWVGRHHSDESKRKISASKWKGGSRLVGGRRHVRVPLGHPARSATGYAPEHRLLMAEALCRSLRPTEHVHHIDLDKRNNALTNLVVLSPSQHSRLHGLIRNGARPFDALIVICREDDPTASTPSWRRTK